MKKIDQIVTDLGNENRYAFYLGFFRVFVCLLLLKGILLQWRLVPLLYAGKDYLVPTNASIREFFFVIDLHSIRSNIYIFLGAYLMLLLLFLFGIGKNFTALLLFLCCDILQKLCPQVLNGGDNYLRFILLYFCFANTFDFFSITRYTSKRGQRMRNFCSNLAGLSICIHLCLIYFISAVYKIHADVWFNGVATYYTLNLERFNGTPFNGSLSKNAFFVSLSTYSTWLIELFYPVLVWFKQTKKTMIVLALLLHSGIAVLMMLYDFQLVFIFAQGFFVSNSFWLKVYNAISSKLYTTETKKPFSAAVPAL